MEDFLFKSGENAVNIIQKKWGREEIFISNDIYCFKRLVFNKGYSLSMHFHVNKHETWEILSGGGLLSYYNYNSGNIINKELYPGDVVTIPNFQLHRFQAKEDTIINEVSTKDEASDSYRTMPSGEFKFISK